MNNIAISPYIAMYALQIQNVQRNTTKKMDVSELNQRPMEEKELIVQEETDLKTDSENKK
jgi:hypothetical protein